MGPGLRTFLPVLALVATGALACGATGSTTREQGLRGDEADSSYDLHRSMAVVLLRGEHPDRALTHIQRMAAAKPDAAEPHHLQGYALAGLKAWPEARAALEKAVAADPQMARAHALLGVVLDSTGDHVAAEARHREAVRLDAGNAGYRNNLGFSLYLQGRWPEAQVEFQRALDREPGMRKARLNLAFACGRAGDVDRAAELFRQAGADSEAMNNLGLVHELRGDPGRARAAYQAALQLDPELIEARQNLQRVGAGEGGTK